MGKFVIEATPAGCRFRLKAANGETLGLSETYRSLAGCRKGIQSVARSAAAAPLAEPDSPLPNPRFEIFQDRQGRWRFRLRARNGKIILASQAYAARAGCEKGVESVRRNAPQGPVEG